MFWWILLALSGIVLIIGIILLIVDNNSFTIMCGPAGVGMTVVGGTLFLCCILIVGIVSYSNNEQIATFIRQKEYFETVVPTLPDPDNYALTQKKVELNEWLYQAQYQKTHLAFFTLYSDKVLELTEIQ